MDDLQAQKVIDFVQTLKQVGDYYGQPFHLLPWEEKLLRDVYGTVDDNVNCVITDIEMPVMDGHRLVKLIKDDIELKKLPTIIFSSLINDDMKRKGAKLGADFQISKPEIGQLVDGMDKLLGID